MIVIMSFNDQNIVQAAKLLGRKYNQKVVRFEAGCFVGLKKN